MASKSIGELDTALSVGVADLLVIEQDSVAKKLSGQTLITDLATALDGHGGISSIERTDRTGNVDTYTITFADETTETFTVTNGVDGDDGAAAGFGSLSATAAESDTPTVTVSSSGPDTAKSFAFEFGLPKGDTGDAATVVGSAVDYQKSNSGIVVPTGAWTSTIPVVYSGEYLWTRASVRFNTGSTITWYSVAAHGIDGEGTGTVTSVGITAGSGISVNGSPITSTGSITIGHTNSTTVRSTRAVYPVSIDAQGHITGSDSAWATGTDHSAKTVSKALTATWEDGEQTITDADFFKSSGFAYTVAPEGNSFAAYTNAKIYADDVTVNGQMTFHCLGSVPSASLTVNIMRVVSA